ncbi:MAG: 7-cyano-7-deazaguanine synthase QueC [Planctomycetota bacterium]
MASSAAHNPATAVVLTSGGLDSTTVLAIAAADGHRPLALTFRYGQSHDAEIAAAERVARSAAVADHWILDVPLGQIGGSALVGDGPIPDAAPTDVGGPEIPVTYVPARNLVFLSLATACAEARGIRDIYIGVNAVDYSGYPDCRPAFIESFAATANLGTRDGVENPETVSGDVFGAEPWFRIHTPLADRSKADIIRAGLALGVDYAQTVSCYRADVDGRACGRCDACELRRRGFEQAGAADPTRYG